MEVHHCFIIIEKATNITRLQETQNSNGNKFNENLKEKNKKKMKRKIETLTKDDPNSILHFTILV